MTERLKIDPKDENVFSQVEDPVRDTLLLKCYLGNSGKLVIDCIDCADPEWSRPSKGVFHKIETNVDEQALKDLSDYYRGLALYREVDVLQWDWPAFLNRAKRFRAGEYEVLASLPHGASKGAMWAKHLLAIGDCITALSLFGDDERAVSNETDEAKDLFKTCREMLYSLTRLIDPYADLGRKMLSWRVFRRACVWMHIENIPPAAIPWELLLVQVPDVDSSVCNGYGSAKGSPLPFPKVKNLRILSDYLPVVRLHDCHTLMWSRQELEIDSGLFVKGATGGEYQREYEMFRDLFDGQNNEMSYMDVGGDAKGELEACSFDTLINHFRNGYPLYHISCHGKDQFNFLAGEAPVKISGPDGQEEGIPADLFGNNYPASRDALLFLNGCCTTGQGWFEVNTCWVQELSDKFDNRRAGSSQTRIPILIGWPWIISSKMARKVAIAFYRRIASGQCDIATAFQFAVRSICEEREGNPAAAACNLYFAAHAETRFPNKAVACASDRRTTD